MEFATVMRPLTRYCFAGLLAVFAAAPAGAAGDAPASEADEAQPPIIPAVVGEAFFGDLPEIVERGELRALVSFSRTDFFLLGAQPKGIQVELLDAYLKFVNQGRKRKERHLAVKYVPVPFDELIPALREGKGDVAVGNLTVTPAREKLVDFAVDARDRIDELLVTHGDIGDIRSVDDLSGRTVYVLAGSSYLEHLTALSRELEAAGEQPIDVRPADPHLVTEDLLELVNAGAIEMTVADDYRAKLWAQVLPDIVVREDVKINEGGSVGWAVRKDTPELRASLQEFAGGVQAGSLIGNVLIKRYYRNTKWITNPLADADRERLERLIELFETYGSRYDFDWLALGAQAYQESRLDHSVKSPVGAIGIMQILPTTARDPNVGIPDIEKLEKNIEAGAKYMAFLRARYFSDADLAEEDRFALTWAAYNAGPAKVGRMREKAAAMGLDPDRWFGNVEHAALAIVGQETVRYVSNIYKYYVAYRMIGQVQAARARELEKQGESGG